MSTMKQYFKILKKKFLNVKHICFDEDIVGYWDMKCHLVRQFNSNLWGKTNAKLCLKDSSGSFIYFPFYLDYFECGRLESKNRILPWFASFGSFDNAEKWQPICDAVLVIEKLNTLYIYRVRHKFCDNFNKSGHKAEVMAYKYKFYSLPSIPTSV